jgi:hypothetical protein
VRAQIRHQTREIGNWKKRGFMKYLLEASLAYPLTVAWTRILTHSVEDSRNFGVLDAFEEAANSSEGIVSLWNGLFPFLLAHLYEDLTEAAMRRMQKSYPEMDSTDEAVVRICLVAQSTVLTSPLYALSTMLRARPESPGMSVRELLASVDWSSLGFQFAVVSVLCAINLALLHDKHQQALDDE